MDFLETFVMDDASKAYAKPFSWSDSDQLHYSPEPSPNLDIPVYQNQRQKRLILQARKRWIVGFMNNVATSVFPNAWM